MVTKAKKTGKRIRNGKTSSDCERVFCDWDSPLLKTAAEWLIENHARLESDAENTDALPLFASPPQSDESGGNEEALPIDLSGMDVVLPSSRAIHRLREKLMVTARTLGREYRGPRFFLVGRLPSLLYRRPAEWATDFEETLAWARVLAASDPASLQTLMPTVPDADTTSGWLDLAATARRLGTKVSAENWRFSDVLDQAESDAEQRRWKFLVDAHDRYRAELESAERCDSNVAALDALAENRCRALRSIVLIGASDLTEMVKAMLTKVNVPVAALIAAPESMAGHFDEFGCLIPIRWKEHLLPVRDEQLIPAGGIEDQSQCVGETLAEFGEKYSVDAITIGVTDESQIEPIENHCRFLGVETYRHRGWTLSQTSVGRLLELLLMYQQRRTWRALAALVRHHAVHQFVNRHFEILASEANHPETKSEESKTTRSNRNWLTSLDQLMAEAFPRSIDQPLPTDRDETAVANQIVAAIESWLAPLKAKPQPIRRWSQSLAQVLGTVYPDVAASEQDSTADRSDELVIADPGSDRSARAFASTMDALHGFENLSQTLDTPVDPITAVELLSARISEVALPDHASARKIEILGWLDLALDDAPAMVVCGLNHPFLPEAAASDPFLPTTVQRSLSQRINDRRYARDVHAMHQMLASRESVRFLVGTHSADGSPTPPSRLLAASTPDDAARRVCRLLTENRPKVEVVACETKLPHAAPETPRVDYFRYPAPQPGRTIRTLSVTAFSAYLACPYRFYLRHVLRMRPLDDASLELAANQFGDLVHGALEYFGESDAKDEPDPGEIEKELIAQLHRFADERYGTNTASTVSLQVRQAERRLKTVALRQAERIAQGWRIHAVEASVDELEIDRETKQPKKPTGILLDGEFTGLRGRFDRIDYHAETDRWAILDYKTHGHVPEKKHLKNNPDGTKRWVDLQLPLYRRFIPDLNIPADPVDVELGYFNVAEKDTETKINIASFTESQFTDADELIHHVVRQVRECCFEPNEDGVEFDDYKMMFNEASTTLPDDDENDSEFDEVSA